MSGKSQTIGDFAVLADFNMKTLRHYGGHLGWSGTNRENRERFYFPDASQISAMIGDFPDKSVKSGTIANNKMPDRLGVSRHMKTRLISMCSNFRVQSTYQHKILNHIQVMMQRTKFSFYWTVISKYGRVVAYRRLKTIEKFKSPALNEWSRSLTSGGRLREVSTVVI